MFGHTDHNDQSTTTPVDSQVGGMATDLNQPSVATPAPTATTSAIDEGAASDFIMTEPAGVATPMTSAPEPVTSAPATDPVATTDTNDLLDLKQSALQQLSPLLGHLDQTPEEKFRTTMMMIQASDNQSLLQVAYEAAQGIEDEKTRAQALLDVVNEINYFTQHQDA